MRLSKKNIFFTGKRFLTFWLIFLNCIHTYPIKIELKHNLIKIDENTYWQNSKQSLKFIEEPIILHFFSSSKRDSIMNKMNNENYVLDENEDFIREKDCKKKNDLLIFLYLNHLYRYKNELLEERKKKTLKLQNYALILMQECEDLTIVKNARKILYSLSIYETNY